MLCVLILLINLFYPLNDCMKSPGYETSRKQKAHGVKSPFNHAKTLHKCP